MSIKISYTIFYQKHQKTNTSKRTARALLSKKDNSVSSNVELSFQNAAFECNQLDLSKWL